VTVRSHLDSKLLSTRQVHFYVLNWTKDSILSSLITIEHEAVVATDSWNGESVGRDFQIGDTVGNYDVAPIGYLFI
jgi:hypothetical protein